MRKVFWKRILAAGISAVMALAALPVWADGEAGAAKSVVILHTNDMHGSLIGSSSIIGADSIAALKKSEDAILVDAGDATQGVALASQSKGEDVITIMNAAGYDVMALGNHEFDYGLAQLEKLRDMAEFPMISANTYLDGKPLCAKDGSGGERVIIQKNGVKVGFFALTTQDTATATKPENLTGVEFKDELETAKEQTKALAEEGADVIIALTHMGVLKDSVKYTSEALAEEMSGTELDAIIDGHSHTVYNKTVGGITIAQTGTGSANVGRMEITLDGKGAVTVTETMLDRAYFDTNSVEPDPDVTKVITDVSTELEQTLKTEIGETKNTLWGGSIRNVIAESRAGETNFGSLICDAMIEEAEKIAPEAYRSQNGSVSLPIVAVENGGGFRASVPNGKMTVGSIVNALPFANTVRIKEITPAILYELLEDAVSSVSAQDAETGFLTAKYSGSFPQIGGMRLLYDPNLPQGQKITLISLIAGNTDLQRDDDQTKLILASNDYVIEQGVLENIPMIAEGGGLTEVVLDYVNFLTGNGAKPLDIPVTMGRIVTDGAYRPNTKEYTAHIQLTDAEEVADGDKISFYMDGERYLEAGTVKDGVLDITLPDGPHAIKLYAEQQEAYVNNYSGNGVLDVYGDLELGYPQLAYDAEKVTLTKPDKGGTSSPSAGGSEHSGRRPAVSVPSYVEGTSDGTAETFPFVDVAPEEWYYSSVRSLWSEGLMTGVEADEFGPEQTLTRGMFLTVLGRLEKVPAGTVQTGFADVDGSAYYAPYVAWGSENGIVTGFDADTFGPDTALTREEATTILWRYAKYKGVDVSVGEDTNILSYADAMQISEYAVPALQWACGAQVLKGYPDGTLCPQLNITRAEMAAIIDRAIK